MFSSTPNTNPAHFLLLVAPKIEHFVFRGDFKAGQGLRQTCFVSEGDTPMLVSWFRDGREVDQSMVMRIDEVTSLLAISELTSEHAGNYSCVAKNEVAVVSVTATLVVRGIAPWVNSLLVLTSALVPVL